MKTDLVKEKTFSIGTILESLRDLGDNAIAKPLFYVVCSVVFGSLIVSVVLLSKMGIDLIETHFNKGLWFVGLLVIAFLIGWGAKHFLYMCLELWKMTKEE